MQTVIDNSQRIFIVKKLGFTSDRVICNLEYIPEAIKSFDDEDEFSIFELWNCTLKKCSKNRINQMFKAHKIAYKIITS